MEAAKGKLTARQQLFVVEYLVDLNATQASIRAGYSAKTAEQQGPRLLGNVGVALAIQEAMDKRAKRVEVTGDYVLDTIRETIERCRQVQPVLDRKGDQIMVETRTGEMAPAFVFDAAGVFKGCDLLGKNLQLWKEVGSKDNPLAFVPVVVSFGDEG